MCELVCWRGFPQSLLHPQFWCCLCPYTSERFLLQVLPGTRSKLLLLVSQDLLPAGVGQRAGKGSYLWFVFCSILRRCCVAGSHRSLLRDLVTTSHARDCIIVKDILLKLPQRKFFFFYFLLPLAIYPHLYPGSDWVFCPFSRRLSILCSARDGGERSRWDFLCFPRVAAVPLTQFCTPGKFSLVSPYSSPFDE